MPESLLKVSEENILKYAILPLRELFAEVQEESNKDTKKPDFNIHKYILCSQFTTNKVISNILLRSSNLYL